MHRCAMNFMSQFVICTITHKVAGAQSPVVRFDVPTIAHSFVCPDIPIITLDP